ncbi:hypothetical protein [Nocardia asteroides]|uniref:hypothetical protein n=1 Tax=Nocardia asteroides TaxID=1824 RepID=UPI0033D2853A
MASDRETLAEIIDAASFQAPSYSADAADAVIAAGWRPPAREITDPAELDKLPGRSIVVGHRGRHGTAYQLTSYDGFAQTPMWGSPYDFEGRSTSRGVIEREGCVTVLHVPAEEESRG